MISHKHKFIFITPPKTGSTSITYALLKFADIEKVFSQSNFKYTFDYVDEFSERSKHTSIRKMMEQMKIDEYKLIGSIRNPYDRVVSMWKTSHRGKGRGDQRDFSSWICFSGFNTKLDPLIDLFSYGGKVIVDNFIRFENFQEDFNIVCDKIGIPKQELPHKNKSKHKHYTEYYDDETRQIVAEKYAKDIEHFGYEFGE